MEAFLYGNDVKVLILAAYFAISYMSYTKKSGNKRQIN